MGLNVLLVEDEEALHEALRKLLKNRGDCVISAHGCEEARVHLSRNRFDLALIDWKLGDCKGTDLVPDIPRGTAVFIVTGYSKETIRGAWRDPLAGVLDFHEKPLNWPRLKDSLDRLEVAIRASREDTPPMGTRVK